MINSEFLEDDYNSLIEFQIRTIARELNVKVYSGKRENRLGYDISASGNGIFPLFFQLKTSKFSAGNLKNSIQASRKKIGISDDPGSFTFKLHPDKSSKTYKQHNLLHSLHSSGSYARYVAPFFLKDFTLNHLKNNFKYLHIGPYLNYSYLRHHGYYLNWLDFEHSISIPPHKKVIDKTSVSHSYSYNKQGEVCFHSEIESVGVNDGFFYSIFNQIQLSTREEGLNIIKVNNLIANSLNENQISFNRELNLNSIETFFELRKILSDRFNIETLIYKNE